MSLTLGKKLERSYSFRIPFCSGFYDISVFFNKKNTFLLFRIDPIFPQEDSHIAIGSKINMYKNLKSSKFCDTFIKLHSYRGENLDILNQFKCFRDELCSYSIQLFNETITLDKFTLDYDRAFYDTLTIFGFTIDSCSNDYIFVIAERQNINAILKKKIVRTTGLQIATSNSLSILEGFYNDLKNHGKCQDLNKFPLEESITIED